MVNNNAIATNDASIRVVLRENLRDNYRNDSETVIFEELGVAHGAARVDIAVVNGIMHGYEVKSDLDTLRRLPEQMNKYNSVFDQVTLVVGQTHLHEAVKLVPDWWGIKIAKVANSDDEISFSNIREAEENPNQDNIAIAGLLWREEALNILEEIGQANGVRSKPRMAIYERLAEVLDSKTLKAKVREHLRFRMNWRSDAQLALSGG